MRREINIAERTLLKKWDLDFLLHNETNFLSSMYHNEILFIMIALFIINIYLFSFIP